MASQAARKDYPDPAPAAVRVSRSAPLDPLVAALSRAVDREKATPPPSQVKGPAD